MKQSNYSLYTIISLAVDVALYVTVLYTHHTYIVNTVSIYCTVSVGPTSSSTPSQDAALACNVHCNLSHTLLRPH